VLVTVDWGVRGPQVVGQGAIAAPMFALKGPSMIKGSYPPAFALKHQQKVRNCDQLCFCVKSETHKKELIH
jgi:3-hydroxyisobutyrate dehydrogenase-like beta-hydroxyacid dehydrogenase